MKNLLLLVALVCSICQATGQKSVNRLINQMKKHDQAIAVTLPGWLIRTGFNLVNDEELKLEEGFQDIVSGIKRLRVLAIDDSIDIPREKFRSIIKEIKDKDGYVDYASVRDDGNDVHVMVIEDGPRIKSLVVLVNAQDAFTIINLKTDLDMADLKRANLSFNKEQNSRTAEQ